LGTSAHGQALVAHPDHPPRAVAGVSCSVVWQDAGHWALDYIVSAPVAALRLPPAAPPERTDRLWDATCFELFLLRPDGGYFEFNFSPSGQWAAYRFEAHRSGMRPLDVARPTVLTADPAQFASSMSVRLVELGIEPELARRMAADGAGTVAGADANQFALSAVLEDPSLAAQASARMGLSAVIEEVDGTRSYWALAHPPGDPDFHHPACFGIELPPAASA
jgi:hypothetical protein